MSTWSDHNIDCGTADDPYWLGRPDDDLPARYAADGETPASERIHLTLTDAERTDLGDGVQRLADGYARMSRGAVERLLTELDGETR